MDVKDILNRKLSIVITTYNRASSFRFTLESLAKSSLAYCPITILNNCSTDNTLEVAESYKDVFPNYRVVTHPFNIGGNANIIRSIEYADREYLWICHDDDKFDFSDIEDLATELERGEVDLIQIGCFQDNQWEKYGGFRGDTKDIIEKGYSFFRYSTFTPCNIFRRNAFLPYIITGYNNIANSYTILPFLLSFYVDNKKIYLTKKQLVFAQVGNQEYDMSSLIKWFYNTAMLLPTKQNRRYCFFNFLPPGSKYRLISRRILLLGIKESGFKYFWGMYTILDRLVIFPHIFFYGGAKLIQVLKRRFVSEE